MSNASLPLAELNLARTAARDPRQPDLDATAFGDDGNATASTHGIRWAIGDHSTASIDDVIDYELCFPGRAATHEEAAKVLREVMALPWRDPLHQSFLGAEVRGEQQWNEDQAEDRAAAAESRRGF